MKENSIYEPLLLEVAWEVCNKVGGIYTVIKSKVPYTIERWKGQYCAVGPQISAEIPVEFQARTGTDSPFEKAAAILREEGLDVKFGDWLIPGKPNLVLFNINSVLPRVKEIKKEYSRNHEMMFREEPLVDQVVAFGYMTTRFFEVLANSGVTDKSIIGHFHEWMGGMPIPEIKRLDLKVSTIFTTHATMLGRYIAMNDSNFYKRLPTYDWIEEARKFYIEPQVSIERLAANQADILSTVSKVTDQECEYLLGRKSDVILPNGLEIKRHVAMHEFQNLHKTFKGKINEFIMGHFFNNYTFDLENTMYFFTSGRYEFVNKGYDITIEALERLNARMKKANIDKTVVMFFVTRRPFHTINPLVLELRTKMDEIKRTTEAIQEEIAEKLFEAAAYSEDDLSLPDLNQFVDEYWQFRYKKTLQAWKTPYLPIIVTHNLKNDSEDEILKAFRKFKLFNREEDKVKVIYHPDFIDSTNPLFKLDYPQFVRGTHLGIFPSYYEPWGYTPVECLVRGIPAITSDLSGFGDYAKNEVKTVTEKGIYIVNRRTQSYEESVEQLADYMFDFVQLNRRQRIELRNNVEKHSDVFAWNNLGRHYMEAYRMAMEKM
ncbi:MAG: glycosyltransferase [Saprospiraceae bacterium]